MANPTLIKNYKAGGALAANSIVKPGADDDTVLQAAAVTDALTGVVVQPSGGVSGDLVDVAQAGTVEVKFGGAVTRGGPVTSDASGLAVAAAPAAGTNNRIIGFALVSAVSGDIGPILLAPGQIQG